MTFINVEPYKLEYTNGSLQPVLTGQDLTPVEATTAFRLSTEPYVFVVGADGKVSVVLRARLLPGRDRGGDQGGRADRLVLRGPAAAERNLENRSAT